VATKGDTDKWTTELSALVHSDRAAVELKPRDLLRLDGVILEVELKKASVGKDEIKVRCALNSVWFATECLPGTDERFITTRSTHFTRCFGDLTLFNNPVVLYLSIIMMIHPCCPLALYVDTGTAEQPRVPEFSRTNREST
jgi:hypothetical protein